MHQDNPIKNISSSLLTNSFERFRERFGSSYPTVKNPEALVKGIDAVVHAMNEEHTPKNILLYVVEDELDRKNPYGARYILAITRTADPDGLPSFAIRIFYNETNEMEALSTVEPDHVEWSADDLTNTMHATRTKYYLGFTYMLCEKSPGFDEEMLPEEEITLEEFLEYGVEGDIPTELIDISVEDQITSETDGAVLETAIKELEGSDTEDSGGHGTSGEAEAFSELKGLDAEIGALFDEEATFVKDDSEESDGLFDLEEEEDEQDDFDLDDEEELEDEADEDSYAIPEEDDTQVVLISPEEYDEEYDDLETDYEELFE